METEQSLQEKLKEAIKEVNSIDSMLNEYESTLDKKLLTSATANMKTIASELKSLSSNPKCKTKENAPLLSQLSSQMKELIQRTKQLASSAANQDVRERSRSLSSAGVIL
jgi:DNA repair exonuclease SbcCD ATPase subunit